VQLKVISFVDEFVLLTGEFKVTIGELSIDVEY